MQAVFGNSANDEFVDSSTNMLLGEVSDILTNRWSWLGAGILGVFLALTIPIGHPFWTMAEPDRTKSFYIVLEHISAIGGLMLAAALGHLLARRPDNQLAVADDVRNIPNLRNTDT